MPLIFRFASGAAAEPFNAATSRRAAHALVAGHAGDKNERNDQEKKCFGAHYIICSYWLLSY
jgi:hypothetical protein